MPTRLRGPGVFRFTPPAQVIASFAVALDLFDAEGGQPARLARYRTNADTLHDGMRRIGLAPTLAGAVQGPIVLNVDAPDDPAWSLQGFVDRLKARGFLISNFYNTAHPSFRVGMHRRGDAGGHAALRRRRGRDARRNGRAQPSAATAAPPERGMATDLEIARAAKLRPIAEIAARAGIPADALEPYGRFKAKIGFDFIRSVQDRPDGALVLVTGINPTAAGEGKTTTTIGLGDALNAAARGR